MTQHLMGRILSATVILAFAGMTSVVWAEKPQEASGEGLPSENTKVREVDSGMPEASVSETEGQFLNHKWRISRQNNVVYWDGKPYIPFGIWGGSVEKGVEFGLTEFCPKKAGLGEDLLLKMRRGQTTFARAQQGMREEIAAIVKAGGTYVINMTPVAGDYATGNTRLKSLADSESFHYVNKCTKDVSKLSGRTADVDVSMRPFLASELLGVDGVEAFLFDCEAGSYSNVSAAVESFSLSKGRERREGEGNGEGEGGGMRLIAHVGGVRLPASRKLVLSVLWKVRYGAINGSEVAMCSGAGGYLPMWHKGIYDNTRDIWTKVKPDLVTDSLRGINLFGGEVLLSRIFLVAPSEARREGGEAPAAGQLRSLYPNYNDDVVARKEFSAWLQARFGTISSLNKQLGAAYNDFAEVRWQLPIRPGSTSENLEKAQLFGLFASIDKEKKTEALQNEFHMELFGKWYGEYSKLAKSLYGNVPTFTYASEATMVGDAVVSPYSALDVHISAIRHGVDGIGLSTYEGTMNLAGKKGVSYWRKEGLIEKFKQTQQRTGLTKFMWLYEGTCVGRDSRRMGGWLGPAQKSDLDLWLNVLSQRGVTGFFAGAIFPEVGSDQSWKALGKAAWYSELKQQTLRRVTDSSGMTDKVQVPEGSTERERVNEREGGGERKENAGREQEHPKEGGQKGW